MVEPQPSKLIMPVRSRSAALYCSREILRWGLPHELPHKWQPRRADACAENMGRPPSDRKSGGHDVEEIGLPRCVAGSVNLLFDRELRGHIEVIESCRGLGGIGLG